MEEKIFWSYVADWKAVRADREVPTQREEDVRDEEEEEEGGGIRWRRRKRKDESDCSYPTRYPEWQPGNKGSIKAALSGQSEEQAEGLSSAPSSARYAALPWTILCRRLFSDFSCLSWGALIIPFLIAAVWSLFEQREALFRVLSSVPSIPLFPSVIVCSGSPLQLILTAYSDPGEAHLLVFTPSYFQCHLPPFLFPFFDWQVAPGVWMHHSVKNLLLLPHVSTVKYFKMISISTDNPDGLQEKSFRNIPTQSSLPLPSRLSGDKWRWICHVRSPFPWEQAECFSQ